MDMCDTEQRVHIRWMIRRDMAEVLAIENLCFEYPWSEKHFIEDVLRRRDVIGMVAEHGHGESMQVSGFVVYALAKKYLEVLNFAVHPELQRRGVGRQMIDKLKSKLSPQRRTRLVCDVSEWNTAAQLFFKAMGFRCVSVLWNYYDLDEETDAYHFRFIVPEELNENVVVFERSGTEYPK